MNLTDQQYEAITNHQQNLIVTAGAGSGKTRVLVERYLRLLEANPSWSLNALVAITFTKKAAEEMRDRVRQGLESQLNQTGDDRWAMLLGQIDSARIDTIHGLCASILRANAAYAAVDPDFEVLDEIQASIYLNDAVDVVLQTEQAAPLILEYGVSVVRRVLTQRPLLDQPLPEGDLIARWRDDWETMFQALLADYQQEVVEVGTVVDPPEDDKLGQCWIEFLSLWDDLPNCETSSESYDVIKLISQLTIGNVGANAKWGGDKAVVLEVRGNLMHLRDYAKTFVEMLGDPVNEVDERAAELLTSWGDVIQLVKQHYDEVKATALDFDDLEQFTCDVLKNLDVQMRYRGTEFKHLLVDEFQDTNAFQWQIVKSLADLNQAGSMFVVGDQKQSIYGFRGADVSVFGDVQDEIVRHGGKLVPLSQSFRTHQPLVNCFNSLFSQLLVQDEASPVKNYQVTLGEPMMADRSSPDDEPFVEVILIPTEDDDGRNSTDYRRWEAYELAERIHELVRSGQVVFDKALRQTRPMRYDDVAILFRALTNANLYEDVFKAQNLPFVTVAGRGYYDRQEVQDLLNLLKAVYNPADNLALASVLRSPIFGLSDDALLVLRMSKIPLLWDAIANPPDKLPADEHTLLMQATQTLTMLRDIAGRVTIAELLQEALSRTGYLATLTALPDGSRRRGNVEKLLDKAQSSGQTTLGAFTQYLSDLTAIEAREGEASIDASGAVTLMTIHASKGLEFPVVILADASRKPHNADSSALIYADELACKVYDGEQAKLIEPFAYRKLKWLNKLKEEAQNLRLLYVALTRAQDRVIISGQAFMKKDGTQSLYGWIKQLAPLLELENRFKSGLIDFEWGTLRFMFAETMPDIIFADKNESEPDDLTVPDFQLLTDVVIERTNQATHLAASHIADLGGYETTTPPDQLFYRNRFRQRVLHDAPTSVETITPARNVRAHQIGDMVHEALRYGRIPGAILDSDLRALLEAYAWRLGITDQKDIDEAVQKSLNLLHEFAKSDLYAEIRHARQIYREIPFIYERSGIIIHGVIDTLYQRQDETWVVVDYKTSFVKEGVRALADHARRYHLQIGIYAEAVEQQLGGIVPKTAIHYIRYTRTVDIDVADWRKALNKNLWDRVSEVVKDED